jgi:two-component system OmpR family sensor kinase
VNSVRRYLLLSLLSAVAFAGLLATAAVYYQAREEFDEVFDYHLRQMALSLRDRSFERAAGQGGQGDGFDFVIQIWDGDGTRIYLSSAHAALPDRAQLGYATVNTDGGAWRIYSAQRDGTVVQVAQPMSVRNELATAAALRTLTPFMLLLPALGALIWIAVGRGMRPLAAVAGAVHARNPTALQPLPDRGLPQEVQPLVAALNDLLARLAHALEIQREFVADAAHELRTPLTALRLQVQLAERAQTAAERASAFVTVKEGLARATRLVEQLLALARQEPEALQRPFAAVDLGELARQVVAELALLAENRGIDLGMGRADALTIQGDREGLRVMLANLVDNAIRYTPAGGRVDASVYPEPGGIIVEVLDTGPGIPVGERERVFNRFYRRPGTEVPGSGLGLALVKNIADRHHARIILAEGRDGHGLAARVSFSLDHG